MSTRPPPAMRLKSHWFVPGEAKSPAEQAGAMAFIVFRIGRQLLERMRSAQFDIDIGPPYFAFLRECLCFLASVTDRLAYQRFGEGDPAARVEFTSALVRHLARHLAENQREHLGPEGPGEAAYEDRFIDLFNELCGHYAEFGAQNPADPGAAFEPDFAFVRYFGSRLESVVPAKDRHWVKDQAMAIEAPYALELLQHAMRDLHDTTPRRSRRNSTQGE